MLGYAIEFVMWLSEGLETKSAHRAARKAREAARQAHERELEKAYDRNQSYYSPHKSFPLGRSIIPNSGPT